MTMVVARGARMGPAQVELVYVSPFESLTKYSASPQVMIPELVIVKVTFVGELTWKELNAISSPYRGGEGPQLAPKHPKTVCWDSQ